MIIDIVKDKNIFVSASDFSSVSDNLLNTYSTKKTFFWRINEASDKEWVKINALEKEKLQTISINYNGFCSSMVVDISIDNFIWDTIFKGQYLDESIVFNKDFIFIRFTFNDILEPSFEVDRLDIFVETSYEETQTISFFSDNYVSVKVNEADPMMKDFSTTYLQMLEHNTLSERSLIPENYFVMINYEGISSGGSGVNMKYINQGAVDNG